MTSIEAETPTGIYGWAKNLIEPLQRWRLVDLFSIPLRGNEGKVIGVKSDGSSYEYVDLPTGGGLSPDPIYDSMYAPLLLVPDIIAAASYSTVITDEYVSKLCTNVAQTLIELTSDPAIGSRVRVKAMTAAGFIFAPGAGMSVCSRDSAIESVGQYSVAEAHRISTTEWSILGDVM